MGRHSGYIALGAMYGQPDLLLVPESRVNVDSLVERIKEIYDLQKHCVIVCGEGIIDENGQELGAERTSTDPAGNKVLTGASEALREILIRKLGDDYFTSKRRNESARAAIFTRKIGHTQRGGRPILFDRYYAGQLGGHAVDLLLAGKMNAVSILQYTEDKGFHLGEVYANDFQKHLEEIQKAAKKKNVEAAALGYVEMTLTCVRCHQYVRDEKIGAAPLLKPDVLTRNADR